MNNGTKYLFVSVLFFVGAICIPNEFVFSQAVNPVTPYATQPDEANRSGVPQNIQDKCDKEINDRRSECDMTIVGAVTNTSQCLKNLLEDCFRREIDAKAVFDRTAISQSRAQQSVQQKVAELNKTGLTSITKFFGRSIGVIMGVMGTVALVMFMYGGILWMTSAGNSEKAGQAIQILVWTSLGIVVILTSYTVVDFFFQSFS